MRKNQISKTLGTAVMLLFLVLFTSCIGNSDLQDTVSFALKNKLVGYPEGSQSFKPSSSGEWTLELQSEESDSEIVWAWLSPWDNETEHLSIITQEQSKGKPVTISWSENKTGSERSVVIVATCGTAQQKVIMTQERAAVVEVTPEFLVSDPVPTDWLELPATADGDGRYFITHEMKIGSRFIRNYSFYLSEKDILSHWVAYPLNRWTIGSGSRTEAWGLLDQKVPRKNQAVVSRGFGSGYDRGHQCPSADRYAPGANEATFYGTNMTPQQSQFNQNLWASLEGYVRSWSGSLDTLYVVTGCYTKGSTTTRNDADGKRITVPVGYYKALLAFKKAGNFGVAGGTGTFSGRYAAIGFYFDHKSYYEENGSFAPVVNSHAMSIRELEKKVGEDFFPNLISVIGADKAETVETTTDSFWKL